MTAAVAVTCVTGVLVVQASGDGGARPAAADGRPGPVRAEAHTRPLKTADQGRSASLARSGTEPFSMLGVTWADPEAGVTGTVEARTRAVGSGAWSPWLRLEADSGQGESGAARGGTEPAWVGPSDGVEVRVRSGGGATAGLPDGLRLDMIDPGRGGMAPAAFASDGDESASPSPSDPEPTPSDPVSPEPSPGPGDPSEPAEPSPTESAPTASPSVPASPSAAPTPAPSPSVSTPVPSPTVSVPPAPPSTVPKPAITSRAGWGADESISPEAPGYLPGERIKAVVVHHTAESNSYTCAQAPAVVRGIYAYHVRQLGWKDIGYNFLVDKCGTVYEGRKGGVDRPVMGAHAYGFNAETTGISVLGTYTDTAPAQAAMTAVARVAAWKLGQYGVDPAGTTTLTAGAAGRSYAGKTWASGAKLTLPTIHGHRDGYNTQCPGNAFSSRLGALRTLAGGPVSGLAITSVTDAQAAGSTYWTRSAVTVNWSAETPSSLVKRYELLVGGKVVATTAPNVLSAKATLTAGSHQLAVRAVHQSGRTATTAPLTVVAETTAPTFPGKPALALRTGTVEAAAVPVTLSWKAADSGSLKEVRLAAPARTYGPTVLSAAHSAKPAVATTWKLTAHDRAGNTASASVAGTPVILQETSATRGGTWTSRSSGSYLGGKSLSSSAKNASLSWTFTGRSVSWVVSRAATSGQAHIYVDGVKATTVDLKSATTKYRDAIWTKSWSSSAKHTVKIVVVGTSGRPTITTDGLVYLK
ncbi:N-acetylmuramoyl-L-alanine amidase [Streptomyces sp. NPDC005805]|uniref:peptidoglycan recognition protein family protein n=1 Tax=Streptomyces sp. NPDC005805 TaxID=3157068 RepID=UPI0033DBBDE2